MMNVGCELDRKARQLSAGYLRAEAALLPVLIEMKVRKVFAELNYTGIYDYGIRALGLSPAQAQYFKRVAEKAIEVPALKEAVVSGELTLSRARRLVPVLTQANHEVWIAKAKQLDQRTLEKEVAAANPKSRLK